MNTIKYVCAAVPLISASPADAQDFVTVGALPGGFPVSHALGVSQDGSVVTGTSHASKGGTAFRWTRDLGIFPLPRISEGIHDGIAISPNNNYIAGIHGEKGFVWSELTGTLAVESLPGGRDSTFLFPTVTDTGMTVGRSSFDFTNTGVALNRAVKWTPGGGLEALPLPDTDDINFQSTAIDILADGRIYATSASGQWIYSEQTGFEMLPVGSYMRQINPTGTFMAGTKLIDDFLPHRAAYWTPDTGEVLLQPLSPDVASTVISMSDDGSVIIGNSSFGAILWFDQGEPVLLTDYAESIGIDLTDWQITNVFSISADGTTIVGSVGSHVWGPGRSEGFVLTIPAPATASLACVALVAMRRRRSRYPSHP